MNRLLARLVLAVQAASWLLVPCGASFTTVATASAGTGQMGNNFTRPPDTARPWVFWFWLNGNITREGITADLEAMKRVGIGGVLIMEVDQGAPPGPAPFASPPWRELFSHMVRESARLGIEINMNNDAGWNGSGGPWITAGHSMQKVVWTETEVVGPRGFDDSLAQPSAVADYYRDIAVLAVPRVATSARGTKGQDRLPGKTALVRADFVAPASIANPPGESIIRPEQIKDLTDRLKDGRLSWSVPEGQWTILRFGHTSTGRTNHPAPSAGRGLECDKLSKEAVDAHFAGLMAKLCSDAGPLVGKSLVTTHIDSWEVGSQNWTARFRQEFLRRRGYDLVSYLPTLTGRCVTGAEITERFLWDFRQTISDLLIENYGDHFRELAHGRGLKLSIEAYGDGPLDDMRFAGRADEPVAEFWSWSRFGEAGSCREMASAAHTYGKRILGAEAFTATDQERWLGHPGGIKDLGDWAFCQGINRFIVHRYALQPWLDRRPGMSMGPWGLHYERTQTWWEESKDWHTYLARCQYLLRLGRFVADVCCLQAEGAPRKFEPPGDLDPGFPAVRPAYRYDGCTPEVLLDRMSVRDGKLILPDGTSYRLLVLPDTETMTPELLGKIKDLVDAGATVIGPRPVRSPSLVGFPNCDARVRELAEGLWGNGRVLTAKAIDVLASRGIKPDFDGDRHLRFIHRELEDGTDLYFVANGSVTQVIDSVATFRVAGKKPELWSPDSGRMEPAPAYQTSGDSTRLPLRLDPGGSVFVVFRPGSDDLYDPIVRMEHDGQAILPPARTEGKIVVTKATYGVLGDAARLRDVTTKAQAQIDLGQHSFPVVAMAAGDDPAPNVVKTLVIDYEREGTRHTSQGHDGQQIELETAHSPALEARLNRDMAGRLELEAFERGRFDWSTRSGKVDSAMVNELPEPVEISGPWSLRFGTVGVAPKQVTFARLMPWNEHPDPGIRYFSGHAAYHKAVTISNDQLGKARRLILDLGRVRVIAQVRWNGKELGTLWKEPNRIDVTEAARAGDNWLDITIVNLWPNRMIGDESLPEDSRRKPDGTLVEWPYWLNQETPSPTGRQSFTSWRLWKKDSTLQESGLIGPVTLRSSRRVPIRTREP